MLEFATTIDLLGPEGKSSERTPGNNDADRRRCCPAASYLLLSARPGALYMYLGNANITDSTLSGNKAHRHGGAIYVAAKNDKGDWEQVVAAGQYSEVPAMSVTRTVMQDNVAQANGGEYVSVD